MKIIPNAELSGMNTFRMKVKCACLVEYGSVEELVSLLKDKDLRSSLPVPFLHLGGGSNLLFSENFPGTVFHSEIRFIQAREENDLVYLKVGAGVVWDELCAYASENGWWGIENLSLIPGDAGAAAVQNIGAYGVEVKDVIESVECVDTETGDKTEIPSEACGYGYRESAFKGRWKGKYVITAVNIRLSKNYSPVLDYGHIRAAVASACGDSVITKERLTPAMLRNVVIAVRNEKLPKVEEMGSAGSFFRNPYLTAEEFDRVSKVALDNNLGPVPNFPSGDRIKVPAAWLIEKCGWKGVSSGNAAVYEKQPLVLVNATGNASPEEIIDLKNKITTSVENRFGVRLVPEVEII